MTKETFSMQMKLGLLIKLYQTKLLHLKVRKLKRIELLSYFVLILMYLKNYQRSLSVNIRIPDVLLELNNSKLYKSNANSWMTCTIFEEWLHLIDTRFIKDNRKVCLMIDNCQAHPKILTRQLCNIKISFLPRNTTPVIQPLDQGVIKNFKLFYREKIVMRILCNLEAGINKDINLIEYIIEINNAWQNVKAYTIKNCFVKGLISEKPEIGILIATNNHFIEHVWPEFQVVTNNSTPLVIIIRTARKLYFANF